MLETHAQACVLRACAGRAAGGNAAAAWLPPPRATGEKSPSATSVATAWHSCAADPCTCNTLSTATCLTLHPAKQAHPCLLLPGTMTYLK